MRKQTALLFILLMQILVPLELACAYLAYETLGEITCTLYFLAVGFNLVFVVVAIRRPVPAALGAVVLGLAIIPYQLMLGHRLLRVQREACQIVAHVYETRPATGEYPSDLANYEYRDPDMESFIQSYRSDESVGGFVLSFRVGTENTSHTYTPESGWSYYPD
jgi:hypothetical protein